MRSLRLPLASLSGRSVFHVAPDTLSWLIAFAPVDPSASGRQARMLFDRSHPSRCVSQGRGRVSHVPKEPPRALAVLSDPGRISAPRLDGAPILSPLSEQRRLQPHHYFEAQSHGFGTGCLRFVPPLLATTQNSLPGVANLFRVGLDTHRVPLSNFCSFASLALGLSWRDLRLRH